jgi:hypothetical protein
MIEDAVEIQPLLGERPVERFSYFRFIELYKLPALQCLLEPTAPLDVIRPIRSRISLVTMNLGIVIRGELLHSCNEGISVPVVDRIVPVRLKSCAMKIEHLLHRRKLVVLVGMLGNQPCAPDVRREFLPGDLIFFEEV